MNKLIVPVLTALILTACVEISINMDDTPGGTDTATNTNTATDTANNTKTQEISTTVEVAKPEPEKTEGWTKKEEMAIPSYTGSAEVEGWLVYVIAYGDEEVAHFRLSEDSLALLPPKFSEREYTRDFKLRNEQTLITKLGGTSEGNTAKARITNITIPMEGTPYFESLEILN